MPRLRRLITCVAVVLTAIAIAAPAVAQDKVKMGLFIASSAMPYFIAKERGYFAAENLDVEGIPIANHPLIVQALVKGDIDTASNLLSLACSTPGVSNAACGGPTGLARSRS